MSASLLYFLLNFTFLILHSNAKGLLTIVQQRNQEITNLQSEIYSTLNSPAPNSVPGEPFSSCR